MKYHITVEIDAADLREASHYAEGLTDGIDCRLVRVCEAATDAELEAAVADHATAFDAAAMRLNSDPRSDRDDLSPLKRPVWWDEGYDGCP